MTHAEAERLRALLVDARAALAGQTLCDEPIRVELQRALTLLEPLPLLGESVHKSRHPVVPLIGEAVRHGSKESASLLQASASLLEDIALAREYLPWQYSYPTRADVPDLGRRMAFAELIGPEAPFRSDIVCLGFTLIGPNTLYPAHHHPATELYYVLAGTSTWMLNGVSRRHVPGAFILHPSHAVHAMRTDGEPLLALYTWTGPDVRTSSTYCIG